MEATTGFDSTAFPPKMNVVCYLIGLLGQSCLKFHDARSRLSHTDLYQYWCISSNKCLQMRTAIQHLSLISATQEVNELASGEFMHVLDAPKTDSSRLTHPFENKHPGNCSLWCYLAERRRSTGKRADRYSAPCYLQALYRTAGNGAIGYSFS